MFSTKILQKLLSFCFGFTSNLIFVLLHDSAVTTGSINPKRSETILKVSLVAVTVKGQPKWENFF